MTSEMKRPISSIISIVLSGLMFSSLPTSAQTVAEAARQERERKQSAAHARHVYTNEDLARPQILVPEDQAQVAAPTVAAATTGAEASNGDKSKTLTLNARQVKPSAKVTSASLTAEPQVNAAAATVAGMGLATAVKGPKSPAAFSSAAPRSAASLMVPIPAVNLPQQIGTTTLASPKENVIFPGLSGLSVSRVRTSVPLADVTAPFVPYVLLEMPMSGLNSIHLTIPAELNATTPITPERPASEPSAPVVANTMTPALPLASRLGPIAIGLPGEFNFAPATALTPERISTLPEAPVIAPSAAPAAFDTTQPLPAPLAPSTPADKPIQPPARSPKEPGMNTVLVQSGDSLWKLAERYLGKAERWVELAKLNPQFANPSLIRPGEPIHLPKSMPVHENARTIVIRRGDTLWSVARVQLGQGPALSCIMRANPQIQSPDVIQAGETLILPQECPVSR